MISLKNKSLGKEVLECQDFTISEFYRPFINRLIVLIPRTTFSFRVDSLLFFRYTFVIQYAVFSWKCYLDKTKKLKMYF